MIYNEDCVSGLKKLPSNSVHMVITSPPYDDLRTYTSDTDLHKVGMECHRILVEGGMMAVIMQDSTKHFGKSLTTFKTVIDYCDTIGFKLFECVIWQKGGRPGAWWNKRFRVDHEYILLFLKGERPRYFNKEPLKVPTLHPNKTTNVTTRLTNGSMKRDKKGYVNPEIKCRGTVWNIPPSTSEKNPIKRLHPATMPDKLALDLITCFTDVGDTVVDPFLGSGTSGWAAQHLHRDFIGYEIDETYYKLCEERLCDE